MKFSVSERFACKVLGQHRSTQRKKPQSRPDEEALTTDIIRLASRYGRYGYRRITAMLRSEGWTVNAKRVERIWRREGLKVPQKQPKRGRLWLNDGSCVRLMLNIIDEFTRECLAIRIDRKLNSTDVIDVLSDLFILRGVPGHVRSDNGPEFIAKAVRVDCSCRREDRVHRARKPLGERSLRKLQLKASRRTAQQRDLLQPRRGQGHHRGMATLLQHRATTLIARI